MKSGAGKSHKSIGFVKLEIESFLTTLKAKSVINLVTYLRCYIVTLIHI
jgi:hypothetical protein